ncbi:MAG: O-antigen ligase family protein [Candidatus Riflebacteria bacterium]|nr:O-antigen ligase family protein [Candidatus Riflebacteria bacterium]
MLFVTPWLISTEFKEVFNTTKNCFLGFAAILMAIAFAVETVGRGELVIPRLPAIFLLCALFAWMTVTLAWSGSFNLAVRDWGFHLALFTIFGVTVMSVTSRERMENLLHFAIAAGVIVAGFATLQYYQFDDRIFGGLSRFLFHEDTSRVSAITKQPECSGLLSILPYETARTIHSWIDPRFLILPAKPEEPSKNYSFMGHRNYLAGYVIALIPLVMSRLMAHVDVLLKALPRTILYGPASKDAIQILSLLLFPAVLLSFYLSAIRLVALLLGAALTMCLITQPLVRSVFVYLASLVLMFVTVLQTHTRGSWIGLALGIPFLVIMVWWKELTAEAPDPQAAAAPIDEPGPPPPAVEGACPAAVDATSESTWPRSPALEPPAHGAPSYAGNGSGEALFLGIALRLFLLAGALVVKILFVGRPWSWFPLLLVFGELILRYALLDFKPRFLHREALLLSILPFIVVILAFNWKSVELFGFKLGNPLNKEWVSALDRLDDTFKFGVSTSTHQRWLIYRTTFRIIFDSPANFVFGTGIGTFGLHYMPYQAKVLILPENEKLVTESNKSIYAHDEYLHYWSELGLVGLVLFVLLGLSYVHRIIQVLRGCRLDYDTLLFIGIIASIVSVMAHILFSFCLHLAYTASLFYCMVAFSLRFFPCPVIRLSVNPRVHAATDAAGLPFHVGLALSAMGRVVGWVRFVLPKPLPAQKLDLPPIAITVTDPRGKTIEQKYVLDEEGRGQKLEGKPVGQVLVQRDAIQGRWTYRAACGSEVLGSGEITVGPQGYLPQVVAVVVLALVAYVPAQRMLDILVAEYHWRAAFLKFRVQKFEDSFLDYIKAVESDGGKGEILFDFGRALMDSGRNHVAVRVFEKATANFVDPANYHNIALCYYKEASRARERGDRKGYEEALGRSERAYRNALDLNIIYEQSLSNLIFMLMDKAQEQPAQAREHLAEAEKLGLRGVKYYRANPTFWTAYGVVLAREEKLDESILPLMRALAQLLRDRCGRRIGELKSERETHRAQLNQLSSAPRTAPASMNDAVRSREVDAKIQEASSQIKELERLGTEARKAYDDATGGHFRAQLTTAGTPESKKLDYEKGLAGYKKVLSLLDSFPGMTLDSNADKIRLNLAAIFQSRRQDDAGALDMLERLSDKNDAAARNRFLSIAVAHYNKQLAARPHSWEVYLEYATRLVGWGFDGDATRVLYRLLEMDKTNRQGILLLAECLYRQKYVDEAVREYQRLLTMLPPGDELAKRVQERLDLIQIDRKRPAPAVGPKGR